MQETKKNHEVTKSQSFTKIMIRDSWRLCVSVVFSIVAFAGCSKDQSQSAQQPPVPVVVGTVAKKDVPVQVKAVGTVEPITTVSIKPQVGGVLKIVHFKEGLDVGKGEVLFTIDPRPYQARLAQAQADLQKVIAEARNAREQANRYEGLVQKDYVTKEEYATMRTNAEALEAAVDAAKAAVTNAQLLLGYCTIRSPLAGRTGNLMVHEGNVVKENDTVMVDVNQIRPIYVRFAVPQEHLTEIRKQFGSGRVGVQSYEESSAGTVSGVLTFVDNAVDRSSGTILLKGTFENADAKLWPGEFANVIMTLSTRPNAIVVPAQSVETGQEGQFVFVVKKDMTAEQRRVVVGQTIAEETIIEEGLEAGETVVTDGQLRLLPGSKVEIKSGIRPGRAAL